MTFPLFAGRAAVLLLLVLPTDEDVEVFMAPNLLVMICRCGGRMVEVWSRNSRFNVESLSVGAGAMVS